MFMETSAKTAANVEDVSKWFTLTLSFYCLLDSVGIY